MSTVTDQSQVIAKTKELCETIVQDPSVNALISQVEAFLNDNEAKLHYQRVHELGDTLNQKQRAGVELSDTEINEFEVAREQLLENAVVTGFLDAQRELQGIQSKVTKYVSLAIELGKVPTEEEVEAASQGGGCCGGGGGGGCGC